MHFEGRALMVERIVNFLIRLLPDLSINGDTETPINVNKSTGDGGGPCLFQIRDINIHL